MKKKLLFLLSLSTMVMGGCSKSEIDDGSINSNNVISFETSANKLTKAPVLDNEFVVDESFGVYAYYTGSKDWASADITAPNFMNNQAVIYNGAAWTYTPMKYWPNSPKEKISFFGYMPYGASNTSVSVVSGSKLPQIEFTQNMDAKTMLDLTVAQALNKTKTTSVVTLPFNHILTRLNFKGRVDHDLNADFGLGTTETNVYVTDIKVLGEGNNSGSKLLSKATYELADGATSNGAWNYTSPEVATDDLAVLPILKVVDHNLGETSSGAVAETIKGVKLTSDGEATTPLLQDDEYLFFIPPSADGVESVEDIKFAVTYTVVTDDPTVENDMAKSESTVILSMPNGTLKSEVAYNIIMTFGLDEVVVDAEAIEDWMPNPEEEVYPVVKGEAQTAAQIEEMIKAALDNSENAVIAYNQAPTEKLDVNIETTNTSATSAITLNLLQQTGDVNITTTSDYKGPLTINAPKATVTVNGGTYENLTVWTAPNTLKIAAGTTVDGLTICAGNVAVYGTLTGDVKAGENLKSSNILLMPSAINTATIADDTKIIVHTAPTADGVYYSLDSGAWTAFDAPTLKGETSHTKIAYLTVGASTMNRNSLYPAYYNENLLEIDLSQATWDDETFGNSFSSTGLVANKVWKISIPKNVKSIHSGPFYTFRNTLTDVVFNDVITEIGYKTFYKQKALENVVLPETVTTLGGWAFRECENLRLINIENITSFGEFVFLHCHNLAGDDVEDGNFDLNNAVTSLPANFIANCYKITSITLHEGLSSMSGNGAFQWSGLKSIIIPASLTNLATYTFNHSDIAEITFPNDSNISLVQNMFSFCKSLTTFDFTNVVSIGDQAFYSSALAGDVVIPSTVDMSTTNNSICFAGTEISTFEIEEGGENFTLGDAYLFSCVNMTSVTFPSSLQGFSGRAIGKCPLLSNIVCKATTVPTATETDFGYIDVDDTNHYVGNSVPYGTPKILYVPADLVDDYENPLMPDGETENYWKTILQDKCNFKVKAIDVE